MCEHHGLAPGQLKSCDFSRRNLLKATGATAFIKQLPGAKGPTRNLMKGTGLEEAEIKGHYLILTWAEFTSLKAPAGPKQRAQLDAFSRALVGRTANISLTSRELLGKPATP